MAIGGRWYKPHMIKLAQDQLKYDEWALNPENVKVVKDGMYGVVNEGGTGVRAMLPHIDLCGKTGTAQLASYDYMKSSGRAKELRENAWFIGFAPRDNPEIVVAALFEHGEHGQYAAAIVRDVIKAYFDKKARMEALKANQQTTTAALSFGISPQGPIAAARVPAPAQVPAVPAPAAAEVPPPPADSRPRN